MQINRQKSSALLPSLESLSKDVVDREPLVGKPAEVALGFFDLVGSTEYKLANGHVAGVEAALQHNGICEEIAQRFDGRTVKSLGDGLLMTFGSSIEAALTAVNAIYAMQTYTDHLETKIGLTTGTVEKIKIGDISDVMGIAVDRCSRLQARAAPNEIVIDDSFYYSVQTLAASYGELHITDSKLEVLKGFGAVSCRRLELLER